MAQNIEIANAQYNDVPSIEVPKQGGGTASFIDTSDADATASDILAGKTAYVNGVKIVGTGSGGGGVYTETVLFEDSSGVTSGTINLDGNISDYNLIEVGVCGTSTQNINATIYTATYVLASNDDAGNTRIITSRYDNSSVTWAKNSDTSIVINSVTNNGKLTKIVGIKF